MRRTLFLLCALAGYHLAEGQQIISSAGGWFENERISCQQSIGEIRFGAEESTGNALLQIVSGTFSPSEGIISPTGNESVTAGDGLVRLAVSDHRLHVSYVGTAALDCRLYSLKGELLHQAVIHAPECQIPLPSQKEMFLIQFIGTNYRRTFKFITP